MFRTVQVNKPEFLELLMEGPFRELDRSTVLAAISDTAPTSPIKVAYELKLDEALKAERQVQIRESAADPQEEVVESSEDQGSCGGWE